MKFSFGIITSGGFKTRIDAIIDSIKSQQISDYEIIIVGGTNAWENRVKHIEFNEKIKDKWITRKKNLITSTAVYENIVYLHDYVMLNQNWYKGFLEFGNNFDICTNKIFNANGERYRDWTLWADVGYLGVPNHQLLLPYTENTLSGYMYISGAYWVSKKSVMEEFPLNENLSWGQGEDVEWSKRVRKKYNFKMNSLSSVRLLKQHINVFRPIDESELLKLKNKIGIS